ncbi:MAG: hypothetical protein HRU20_02355 [Pseudomonadales bacterium]|nr:hypothetical protein [Pseudomonadales bacterium]
MKKPLFILSTACVLSLGIAACKEEKELPIPPAENTLTFTNTVTNTEDGSATSTFIYDAKGQPISQSDDIDNDATADETVIYNYNDNGSIHTIQFYENAQGIESASDLVSFSYNEQTQLSVLNFNGDAISYKLKNVIIHAQFNGYKLRDHFADHQLSNSFIAQYSYHSDGSIAMRKIFNNGNNHADEKLTYSYNGSGLLTTITTDNSDDGMINQIQSFDEQSRLVVDTRYNSYPTPGTIYSHSYDAANGNKTEYKVDYNPKDENGVLDGEVNVTRNLYSYTQDNREWSNILYHNNELGENYLISIVHMYANDVSGLGNLLSTERLSKKNNDHNNKNSYFYDAATVVRKLDSNSELNAENSVSFDHAYLESHDEHGNLTEAAYDSSPSIDGSVADDFSDRFESYHYNSSNHRSSYSYKNGKNGALVESKTYNYEGDSNIADKVVLPYDYSNIFVPAGCDC